MKIILFLFAAAQILYQSDSVGPCEPTTIPVIDSVLNATTARVNTLFAMGNPLTIVNCRVTNINESGSFILKLDLAFDVQEAASSIAPGMNLSSAINLTCTSQVIIENTTIDIVSLVCNSTSTNSTPEPSATPTPGPTSTPETTPTSTPEPMTTPTPEPMTSTKRKPPSSSESNESIDSNESSESNESSDSNES
ncbi:protein SGT1 homolog isoform X1 [Chiloscyllium plagiosum]|uniref:protein SGT1 homolog isoform X1 n=1 Tax=Chiloscyllium plagiosum TaxID=36176 RepID=UPI001CB7B64B|nr:protein SGT1 homolog isoform X1 [Chiloscyllium plagiosum]